MNLLMIGILVGYLGIRVNTIYSTNEYAYEKRDLTYTEEEMNSMNFTLGDFRESFSFMFGFTIFDD